MSDSFFGAGFSNDSIAREREAYRSSNPNDMDAQLESMALGNNNLGDRLDEDLDVFNDETFDGDIGEIAGREFDFFQSTSNSQAQLFSQPNQQQQQQQQNSQPQQGNLPQLFQKMGISVQTASAPTSNGPSSVSGNMSLASATPSIEQRMPFSFAELESQALHRQATPMQVNQPFSNTLSLRERRADPEVIAQRREERLRKQEELSRYNNMMSRHDKDYIVKIQVSQLLTDDPAADDFYCHMYQLSRGALFGQRSMQADQQQQQQQQAGASAAASSTAAAAAAAAAAATGYPSAENVPGH
ncbi:DNA topoisomerase 2-associated protein pat1, partial [Coemansia sp. RSA 1804]